MRFKFNFYKNVLKTRLIKNVLFIFKHKTLINRSKNSVESKSSSCVVVG